MKNLSFRNKLLLAFLLIGVVPLLICTILMLNIFRVTLAGNARDAAEAELDGAVGSFDSLLHGGTEVLDALSCDRLICSELAQPGAAASQSVYDALYSLSSELRGQADFALYSSDGALLFTTGTGSADELNVHWGLLNSAAGSDGAVFAGSGGSFQAAKAVSDSSGPIGYAVMSLNRAQLDELFSAYVGTGGLLLLDPYWDCVYSSQNADGETLAPLLRDRLLSGQSLSDGSGSEFYVAESATSGFVLLYVQPEPVADWVMRLLYIVAAVTILICLALCALVSMRLSRQLFEPIRELNAAMGAVEEGRLDTRLEVRSTDEMGQLAGRFNRMAERLRAHLDESVRRRQELSDAQIRMMQAQLNPHFLYNTLDTVKWMGKINQVPEVATVAADLADILRSSISGDEFVTLSQELTTLNRYVEIQSIRFPGKFTLVTDVDEAALDVLVPKLMLQPIVENSIIHGFAESGGTISVTARLDAGELEVTVRDDGCGMSDESMKRFRDPGANEKRHHLGLRNVDAILRLHYGEGHGLRFLPTEGHGTCASMTLPARYKED
ncbi:MAG TPA: sensor histidine kinase [Candidatus Scatomorpha pullistercoris]|uniref:Sensor histidine kinase n=1 Tax=Candidatus Scatomorpha pullistercoris TaxID=2840929 RepID=A0A9D1K8L4_9FIRM|nr:sensor histidine kinase [Candidatus Scatomorpha pullistercoris]